MSKNLKTSKKYLILPALVIFALSAVFGLSLITGNKEQSGIGSSLASVAQPADINNDAKVDVFDLSILLSKWNTTDPTSDLNKDGTVSIFDLSILLSKWGSVVTPPASTGIYGTGFNMDTLANMQVGGNSSASAPNVIVAYRFRAEQSSTLNAFRAFWLGTQYSPGYAGGNGGTIRITVENDNGGVPSGIPLASYDYAPGASPLYPLLTFANPAPLTAGNLYHLVFTNVDPTPRVNFVSLDLAFVFGPPLSPRQPKYPDSDYAALRRWPTTAWVVQEGYTPIIDLTYGNGVHQGQGYHGVEVNNYAPIVGTSKMVREKMTVSGSNRIINKVAVRIAKTSGSGPLVAILVSDNGAVIDTVSITTDSVPILPALDNSAGIWVYGTFSTSIELKSGSTYYLQLSTDSSTALWTRAIQKGSADGYSAATYFADGRLEVTDNGNWSSWILGGRGDLQFYLY